MTDRPGDNTGRRRTDEDVDLWRRTDTDVAYWRRTLDQRVQDARDRRAFIRVGIPVANPMGVRFTGALCACGEVIALDGRTWIHFRTGVVECES